MGKITLEYLAKIAGYSKTTVSRVLSGKGDKYRISKDAQQFIRLQSRKTSSRRRLRNLCATN